MHGKPLNLRSKVNSAKASQFPLDILLLDDWRYFLLFSMTIMDQAVEGCNFACRVTFLLAPLLVHRQTHNLQKT